MAAMCNALCDAVREKKVELTDAENYFVDKERVLLLHTFVELKIRIDQETYDRIVEEYPIYPEEAAEWISNYVVGNIKKH
jgi:hypothetical protein